MSPDVPATSSGTSMQESRYSVQNDGRRTIPSLSTIARACSRSLSESAFSRDSHQTDDISNTLSEDDESSPATQSTSDHDIPELTHLTADGAAHMVDISHKIPTSRRATAVSELVFSHPRTYDALLKARIKKGDAMAVARIAGIQAAKRTSDLIPLAHPGLGITGIVIEIRAYHAGERPEALTAAIAAVRNRLKPRPGSSCPSTTDHDQTQNQSQESNTSNSSTQSPISSGGVLFTATVSCDGKTGVEMEAITAASVSALTMYDMLKGIDKGMQITSTRVVAKSGGKSGDWIWDYSQNRMVTIDRLKEKNMEEQLEFQKEEIKSEMIRKKIAETLKTREIIQKTMNKENVDENIEDQSGYRSNVDAEEQKIIGEKEIDLEHRLKSLDSDAVLVMGRVGEEDLIMSRRRRWKQWKNRQGWPIA